jgi:hypothetical protein
MTGMLFLIAVVLLGALDLHYRRREHRASRRKIAEELERRNRRQIKVAMEAGRRNHRKMNPNSASGSGYLIARNQAEMDRRLQSRLLQSTHLTPEPPADNTGWKMTTIDDAAQFRKACDAIKAAELTRIADAFDAITRLVTAAWDKMKVGLHWMARQEIGWTHVMLAWLGFWLGLAILI